MLSLTHCKKLPRNATHQFATPLSLLSLNFSKFYNLEWALRERCIFLSLSLENCKSVSLARIQYLVPIFQFYSFTVARDERKKCEKHWDRISNSNKSILTILTGKT